MYKKQCRCTNNQRGRWITEGKTAGKPEVGRFEVAEVLWFVMVEVSMIP
jgi:hypothetical protein